MNAEQRIEQQEMQIPQLALTALREARQAALANGCTVLEVQHNQLVEVFADGSMHDCGKAIEVFAVQRGQKISRRV